MNSSRALAAFQGLQDLMKKLPLSSIVQALPKLGKFLICLLFLLNIRSWPLVWHFRVFRPVFSRRLRYRWIRTQMLFKSPVAKLRLEDDWLDSITPIGANPFTMVVPYRTWASPDESDFNGHLSNSSYAKTVDSARFKAAVDMFPMFFPTGGWMALSATHYHFIREIPMLASYEIRTSLGSWDQKWLYVISKFVRKSDGQKKKVVEKSISPPIDGSVQIMALRTPGFEAISSSPTPLLRSTPQTSTETETALNAVAAGLAGEEPDGATLHTIIVSQICFKIGRITVPPGLVMGVNGFTGAQGHSLAAPHSQWQQAKKIMSKPSGGSPKRLKEFLVGGWRDIPEKERWWDQALGEEVEVQRVRNLALIDGLRRGLEHARAL